MFSWTSDSGLVRSISILEFFRVVCYSRFAAVCLAHGEFSSATVVPIVYDKLPFDTIDGAKSQPLDK